MNYEGTLKPDYNSEMIVEDPHSRSSKHPRRDIEILSVLKMMKTVQHLHLENKMSVFISVSHNLQDIKFDLLKVMKSPHDGYMFNETHTQKVTELFLTFLGDPQEST